jgi:phospholipid transport system substrate-binding protein
MRKWIFLCFILLLVRTLPAHGAQPMEAIKGPIDQVISILKDPKYKDASTKEAQREEIWSIINRVFDFTEMAKRTLARNWVQFTPAQRKEFSEVFARFLGNNYIDKIQGGYQDERVVYVGEERVTDDKAVVKTTILRESLEIPVAYSLILQDGAWRVYDVNIEGVSLVKNYRTQFSRALMRQSPDQLIETLKKKKEKQEKGREDAGADAGDAQLGVRVCGVLAKAYPPAYILQ